MAACSCTHLMRAGFASNTCCAGGAAELQRCSPHAVARAVLRLLEEPEQELLLRGIFGPLAVEGLINKCHIVTCVQASSRNALPDCSTCTMPASQCSFHC